MSADPDAVAILSRAQRLVALTGAGVSTESGIPDFRSKGGLWSRFDPSEFHLAKFMADPARFWRLRFDLMREMDLPNVSPNGAHRALAAAERSGRLLGVATQNIDGLHLKAGTSRERLVELHGCALEVKCVGTCGARFPFAVAEADLARDVLPPRCPSCGGVLKPGSVLFGEALPEDALRRAQDWARTCDAMLVVGSSLEVWPAAGLPALARERGASVVVVNREATGADAVGDAVVHGLAGEVVPRLLREAGL